MDPYEVADYISRIRDFDDWMINPALFAFLDRAWGPHKVDCSADQYNKQLPRFHSRFWCPGSEAVDTFTVNWVNDVCWLMPPLHLVSQGPLSCSGLSYQVYTGSAYVEISTILAFTLP